MTIFGSFPSSCGSDIHDISSAVTEVHLHEIVQKGDEEPTFKPRVRIDVEAGRVEGVIKTGNKRTKLLGSDIKINFDEEKKVVLFFKLNEDVMNKYGIEKEHLGLYLCEGGSEYVLSVVSTGLGFCGLRTPVITTIFGQRDVIVLRFAHATAPASFLRVTVDCEEPPASDEEHEEPAAAEAEQPAAAEAEQPAAAAVTEA
jgi:hypothetical protein